MNKNNTDLAHDLLKIAGLKIDSNELQGVKPLYHSSDITARMRKDSSKPECFTKKQALANAKVTKGDYFYTPKTFIDKSPKI